MTSNSKSSILYTDIGRLEIILQSLYTLTNVKISLFDNNKNEIYTYPPEQSDFCLMIRQKFMNKCKECDENGFRTCSESGHYVAYQCHAGLIDALVPLKQNEQVIGYIMFGQMLPDKNIEKQLKLIATTYGNIFGVEEIKRYLNKLIVWNDDQLHAAVAIVDICISYLLTNKIVFIKKNLFIEQLDDYIAAHLSEKISINDLCKYFSVTRTTLYAMFQDCLDYSIKKYIVLKRIDTAKMLLMTTDLSITEVANMVGFGDYNYFLKVFKSEVGTTCARFRKENRHKFKKSVRNENALRTAYAKNFPDENMDDST